MRQKTGQSLIEILAALAVVIIVILALIAVTTVSIRNATFAKNQSLATKYAQEAIEKARELRNNNKEGFFISGVVSCNKNEEKPPFQLIRDCSLVESAKMMVTVVVSWTDTTGQHQSKLSTYLTKW